MSNLRSGYELQNFNVFDYLQMAILKQQPIELCFKICFGVADFCIARARDALVYKIGTRARTHTQV